MIFIIVFFIFAIINIIFIINILSKYNTQEDKNSGTNLTQFSSFSVATFATDPLSNLVDFIGVSVGGSVEADDDADGVGVIAGGGENLAYLAARDFIGIPKMKEVWTSMWLCRIV